LTLRDPALRGPGLKITSTSGQTIAETLKAAKIGTWELSLPGRVLEASSGCKANYGRQPNEEFSYSDLFQAIHPADRERVTAMVAGAIRRENECATEYRCIWPDGTLHWIAVTGSVVFSESGQPEKIIGVTQEISSRKRIESELRESQLRMTSMLDAVDVGTWSVDLVNDKVTPDRNLQRMFFLSEEEAHGSIENYVGRVHPDDRPAVEAAMKRVFTEPGSTYRMEPRLVSPQGAVRWVEVRGDVERDASGKPLVFRGVILDITERKSSEELQSRLSASHNLLKAQEEERRRIARELHDSAGQTLAALCMGVESLAVRAKREAPSLEKVARECSDTAQQLSTEVRTASYLLHPPMLDEIGLTAALGWYVEGLEARSGLKVTLDTPRKFERIGPEVELLIFRLVQECLTNIYRHADSKTATIRLSVEGREIKLSVEDQGKGIPPERLAVIQNRGSGVGLQGMRERVRQINGKMDVQSGRTGTKVAFSFPLQA
jgi:PAS domain S-box-containing protein